MLKLSYKILLTLSAIATLGGILTLIPWPWATYPNILGYRSLCTFAPAASFYCFSIAGTICIVRAVFIKETDSTFITRIKKHIRSFIPLAIMLAIAFSLNTWFLSVKSQYTDTSTSATETAGY